MHVYMLLYTNLFLACMQLSTLDLHVAISLNKQSHVQYYYTCSANIDFQDESYKLLTVLTEDSESANGRIPVYHYVISIIIQ